MMLPIEPIRFIRDRSAFRCLRQSLANSEADLTECVRLHIRTDLTPGGGAWISATRVLVLVLVLMGFGSSWRLLLTSGELLPRIC